LDTLPLTGRRAATTLAVVRGVGAPGWFVPTLTCKLLGLPRNSEQTRNYWFRLFVSRDVALAALHVGAIALGALALRDDPATG
jgi:hypothetical protein